MLYIERPVSRLGALCSVSFDLPGAGVVLTVAAGLQRLRESELNGRLRPILATAPLTPSRDILLALLSCQPFAGQDTLATLGDRILLEVDEAIFCEPDGLALIGWCLAKPGAIRDIRLRCGGLASSVKLDACVRLERPDVLAAVGAQQGYDDLRCGFIAFLPRAVSPDARIYLEVETQRRDVAFKTVPPPKLEGIAAIKRMLGCFDVRFLDVAAAYDRVVGPAAERLNRARLRTKATVDVVDYGVPPASPRFSVIVPLHGRLDFVEYQLGLLSAHAPAGGCELIYVLDDPPKRREAQFLFEFCVRTLPRSLPGAVARSQPGLRAGEQHRPAARRGHLRRLRQFRRLSGHAGLAGTPGRTAGGGCDARRGRPAAAVRGRVGAAPGHAFQPPGGVRRLVLRPACRQGHAVQRRSAACAAASASPAPACSCPARSRRSLAASTKPT